ncbi:mas-related G-protein coupled receptor member H [Microcaecilia unicolor]|uniref:Mas-related G-protein coupled receptor member H-like n=1 Tax=Microcaecilia unicolor TaxID=1415580 RepID=A0A6P7X145_9AMPH|nr:mas-related G-protein coupled receptor member H-like [Microcaecilia unicolor]XP_030046198.1 mas-related G-protein coupled receptor member H-like [Microcaecilia unicolor]XP_030046199.1 mas-related G-protein coupled receptor member H-like [Microcaecilia unicolor]
MMIGLSNAMVTEPGAWTQTDHSTDAMNLIELQDWTTETSNDLDDSIPWSALIVVVFVAPIIALIGMVGNGIVLWFLGFRIKRNKFTVYILNLAIADILFLLSHMVALSFSILSILGYFHFNIETVISIIIFLYLFGYNTSQYFLTAISAERCLSILYPIWYHCQRPKHLSSILCAVLWALASLVAGIDYFICLDDMYFSENSENQLRSCRAVSFFIFLLTFLVFTPIMITSSLIILIKVWRSSLRRHPPKLYIIIVITVALFLASSIPFRVFLFICNYNQKFPSIIFFTCCILLSTINSCLNPLVYFCLGSRKRRRAKRSITEVLQGVFKDETES